MWTFMIFFILFLMGICWWIGLSYDYIYKYVRECAELRTKVNSHPESVELARAYASAADHANHRMSHTISGRLVAKIFNFQRVRSLEE